MLSSAPPPKVSPMMMRHVAERLMQEEQERTDATASAGPAVFRVCEKLRRPLASIVGLVGFRSLVFRALSLAKAEVAWLGDLRVATDGSLEMPAAAEAELGKAKAIEGGVALIARLLDLLALFIGEGLTLQLVQDCWPKLSLTISKKDPP